MSQTDGLTAQAGLVDMDGVDFNLDCGGCRACCYGIDGAIITKAEATGYDSHEAEEGKWRLDQKEDGSCVYLGEEGCNIYDDRPGVCREFDCRSLILKVSPDKLDKLVEEGTVPTEVVQQGRIRMMQFNKSIESIAFADIFLGE